jgi:uncharacterized protein (TIGR03435 family)
MTTAPLLRKLAAFLLAAASSMALAQTPAAAAPSAETIVFDVVSIRQVLTDTRQFGPTFPKGGDGMILEYVPVGWVIRLAYGIDRDNRILGLPEWARENNWDNRYDIRAKVAEADVPAWKAMSDSQRWQVVQRLLADRFQLRLHHETVQRPIYALVPGKGGVKLTVAKPLPESPTTPSASPFVLRPGQSWIELHAPGVTNFHHATMDMLVQFLSGSSFGLGREVFDRTGLTGNYDFTLSYAPVKASASTQSTDASDPNFPDIFTAVQEQLGLKLEPSTGPVETLVVDHIERPSDN